MTYRWIIQSSPTKDVKPNTKLANEKSSKSEESSDESSDEEPSKPEPVQKVGDGLNFCDWHAPRIVFRCHVYNYVIDFAYTCMHTIIYVQSLILIIYNINLQKTDVEMVDAPSTTKTVVL